MLFDRGDSLCRSSVYLPTCRMRYGRFVNQFTGKNLISDKISLLFAP